jgi:hypothetical protein
MLPELIETTSNVSSENYEAELDTEMRKISTIKLDRELYDRLTTIRMSPYERSMAIGAMQNAEAIIDTMAWIARKFESLAQRLSARRVPAQPSFRH